MLSTKFKIKAACALYRLLKLVGFKDKQIVTRSGVRFELDLREGIDLSIFFLEDFRAMSRQHPLERITR